VTDTAPVRSTPTPAGRLVVDLDGVGPPDVAEVGGKAANLGSLRRAGFRVPPGFVVTSSAYLAALTGAACRQQVLEEFRALVAIDDPERRRDRAAVLRQRVASVPVPGEVRVAVAAALERLGPDAVLAVRSSATAEDAAGASFAGAHATLVGVAGLSGVLGAISTCWASAFTDRAIAYRIERGLLEEPILAVVVQMALPADVAGVAFSERPDGSAPDVVVVESARGLGESVVSGAVEPDHDEVDVAGWAVVTRRPGRQVEQLVLSGDRVQRVRGAVDPGPHVLDESAVVGIARTARTVADHFGGPQDVEWALVGDELWILQSRPITTITASPSMAPPPVLPSGTGGEPLRGLGAARGVASGPVRVVSDPRHPGAFTAGDVLVARSTSPDWVPLLRRASAVVTESGGTTCHAAIVSRELGVPCVVGVHDATRVLSDGDEVTVDGSSGTVTPGAPAPLLLSATRPRTPLRHPARRPPGSRSTWGWCPRRPQRLRSRSTAWACCAPRSCSSTRSTACTLRQWWPPAGPIGSSTGWPVRSQPWRSRSAADPCATGAPTSGATSSGAWRAVRKSNPRRRTR
jgi:pyruvate,water dikinase